MALSLDLLIPYIYRNITINDCSTSEFFCTWILAGIILPQINRIIFFTIVFIVYDLPCYILYGCDYISAVEESELGTLQRRNKVEKNIFKMVKRGKKSNDRC